MGANEGAEAAPSLLFSKADVRIVSAWVIAGPNVWRADEFTSDASLGGDNREIPFLRSNYMFTRALAEAASMSKSAGSVMPKVLFNDESFLITSRFFVYQRDAFSTSALKSIEYVERPLAAIKIELADGRKIEHRSLTSRNLPDIAEALKAMASGVAEPQREPELPDAALGGHDRAYAEMAMSDVEDMHKPEDIPDGEDGALTKNGKTTLDDVGQAFMRQMDGVRAKISTLGDQVRRVASQTHTAAKADSDVAPTQGAASDSIQKGVRATERAPAAPALPEPPDGIFYKGAAGSVSRSAIETKSFHVRTDAVRAVEFATLPWHQLPSVVIGFLVTLLVAIVIFFLPADARFILLLVTALIAFQYFKRESDNFKSKQVITLTMNDGTKKYIVEREAIATEMEAFASAVMKVIRR